ncbi:MAG: helix-turn-helix transcriptional regulator [Candidatus Limisoma sp.]|nr:helix-turn-helix transcriptional regulator [Candidatus Limisoma sp.]
MENAVIERVNIVVRSKRVTKKALASKLGTSESLLGKKLNGSCRMDLETIIGILELFNDIDANWLLLGRGAMCIDGRECIGKLDVRKIRQSLSQSLTEFAKNVGVDRSQLSLIESGKRNLSNNVYNKIKDYVEEDNLRIATTGSTAIIGNNSNNNVQNIGSTNGSPADESVAELKSRIKELEMENKNLRNQNYELINKLLGK